MIIVIGEALIDLIGHEGTDISYQPVVGGANANVAVALAQADIPQKFLGRISTDAFGQMIRQHLETNGVDLSHSITAKEQTTLAIATIDTQGVASYSFYIEGTADWAWTRQELPDPSSLVNLNVTAVQFGCLTAAIEPGSTVLAGWLSELATEAGITLSHDLNIRPSLGFNRESELERVLGFNELSHIIKASDADIEWLYDLLPGADLSAVIAQWTLGGKTLLITRGGDGVCLYRGQEEIDVPAQSVKLVDTVGAGDTFMANFLAKLSDLDALGSGPNERLGALTSVQLRSAVQYGNAAAAIVCERRGCQPPSKAEITTRLQAQR
ncbi:carbohydrate kinase [Aquiluna sp.]|nr:carbohydrate kinase [Aquiluna sp.]MDA8927417.1 carbohydrate kinase [Aquiluna sp.]